MYQHIVDSILTHIHQQKFRENPPPGTTTTSVSACTRILPQNIVGQNSRFSATHSTQKESEVISIRRVTYLGLMEGNRALGGRGAGEGGGRAGEKGGDSELHCSDRFGC